jgi:hypothetical protein
MRECGSDQIDPGQGQVDSKECAISGFHHDVDETCALLGGYVACSGNSLRMIEDNLSVPSSRVRYVVPKRR